MVLPIVLSPIAYFLDKVPKGLRPILPPSMPYDQQKLLADAWHMSPDARPSMEEIVERIQALA